MKRLSTLLFNGIMILILVACAAPATPTAAPATMAPEATSPPAQETAAPAPSFDFSGEFWNKPYKAQKEWVIGVSYQNLAFPYVAAMQKAIQNRAAEMGVKIIETDAFNDTNKELANVENLLAQNIDLLLFEAASLEASVASIEAANKAGVPVVQFNGKAEGGDYITFVGSEQIESGMLLGQWLLDLYNKLGKDTLKGIYLRGVAGQITDIARSDGVKKALDDAGMTDKFEFTEQYADYDRGKGQSVTESILSQSTDYDFIIANNDDMILGAMAAVQQAGLLGSMPMCGVDGLPEALSAIKSGDLSATVFQNPEGQAAGGLTAAVWYLEGASPDKEILIPFTLVTPDNVDQIAQIADRVYGAEAGTVVEPTPAPSFDFSGEFWNEPYKAQKEWVLGVSYQNLAFPYVAAMQKAIQNRAAEMGVKIIETDAFNDTNKELANVENLLAQNIDLLLFEAASLEASVASIEAANKAGVPVVQFNGKAEGGDYITFVGSEQIESGMLLGQWLLDLYNKLGKDTLKGIYLRGVAGQITDIARSDGVKKALEDAGMTDSFEFTEQYADYDRGKGQSVTESILSQSTDYDFIIANNDDMILGAMAAVQQAGLLGSMPMCGVDGLPEALDAIKTGNLSATVFQNPEGQAAGGLTAAVWYLEGASPPKEILIPFILVTPDNVDQIAEIANRVYIK